jgi:S1-C subfamily serine protease
MAQRRELRAVLRFLGLAMAACLIVRPAHGQSDSTEKLYQRLLKSTVWIIVPKSKDASTHRVAVAIGSGSLIDRTHRLVLTNYHVVGKDSEQVIVTFPAYENGKSAAVAERSYYLNLIRHGRGIRGKVIAREPKCDLALIQLETVPEEARQLPMAHESPSPGQDVHSVGNPGQSGALWVYTPGKVRQVYHQRWHAGTGSDKFDVDAKIVETQSPINRGDSGGPLVNNKGELVGVTQGQLLDAQQLSLFIDVSEVLSFLKRIKHLPAAARESSQIVANNPEPKTPDDETKANSKLRFAKTFVKDGMLETAKRYCEEIIESYPKTKAAEGARQLLEKLKK